MDFFTKFWAHWEWISSKVLETLEWTFSAVPGTWWAGGIRFLVYCCINTMGTLWMDIFFICFSDIKNGHLQMFCRHWEWTSPNLGDVRNGHLQMFFGTLGMDFIFSCFGNIGNGHLLHLFWGHWECISSAAWSGTDIVDHDFDFPVISHHNHWPIGVIIQNTIVSLCCFMQILGAE